MKSETEEFGDTLWHYAILNDSIRRVEFYVSADSAQYKCQLTRKVN